METTYLDKKNYIELYRKQAGEDRKTHGKKLVYLFLATIVAGLGIGIVLSLVFGDTFVGEILIQLISFFITLYSTKYILSLIDDEKPTFQEVWETFTWKQFGYGLLAYILMVIAIYAGLILLIVPGIILSYMFFITVPIVADKETQPIEALRESKRLTGGYKMRIFLTTLSVTIHYYALPIFAILLGIIAVTTGIGWLAGVLFAIAFGLGIYASFALMTLVPRIYRDLQAIKGLVASEPKEVVLEEEVEVVDEIEYKEEK